VIALAQAVIGQLTQFGTPRVTPVSFADAGGGSTQSGITVPNASSVQTNGSLGSLARRGPWIAARWDMRGD
jgi:hypothetical protein